MSSFGFSLTNGGLFSIRNVSVGLLGSVLLIFLFSTVFVIRNLFFHPLAKYPGPTAWAATRIPYTRASLSGQIHKKILNFHQEYGPIVRVAPDELSYNHPDAWKDVLGHLKGSTGDHGRDLAFTRENRKSIIGANREDHSRFRRALSHGFSLQSMFEQEPIIKGYLDLLIQQLHRHCKDVSGPLDIVARYNWTTFDIIGDLAFGEPFGCLDNSDYHPWVKLLFDGIKSQAFKLNARRYPLLETILLKLVPASLVRKREQHLQLTSEKVSKRLAAQTERPDFMGSMIRKTGSQALQRDELNANASTLIVAGSETTATALSGITFYLTTHSSALTKLESEVRSTFSDESEINMVNVQKLSYLQAVINEGLRMFPPVPTGVPRRVTEGEGVFLDQQVPKDTIVQVWHWPMYHDSANFTLPDLFIPERWLDDVRFRGDQKESLQPFSVGPRNCIGRNLAYAELKLILARMIWNFSMSITDESKDWDKKSNAYFIWEKGPLYVNLSPREGL